MKKDRIIFFGTILVGIILILAGFVISPVNVVPIIGKYYAPVYFDLNRVEIGRIK